MLWDEKYPDVAPMTELREGMLKGRREYPCSICKKPTQWIDISFECHLCSEECTDQMWNDYNMACRKG